MNTHKITQKQFDNTNKSLSDFFDVTYTHIKIEENEIFFDNNVWGGKTIGTTGYKYTKEQKRNISESLKGNKSWLGKTHTEETKNKISKSQTGKKWSEETRKKLTEKRKNQRHSEETKQKMRDVALKREERKRISKIQILGN
jgi:hypothetical protein